ncbi:autotransporter family protein [Bartonella sp. LJL80]
MKPRISNTGQWKLAAFLKRKTTIAQNLKRSTALAVMPVAAMMALTGNAHALGQPADGWPVVGGIIDIIGGGINTVVDPIQNNLPFSKIYLGYGPLLGKPGPDGERGWHKLIGNSEQDRTKIYSVVNPNGVSVGVWGASTLVSTKVQLEHVEINKYLPYGNGIRVWDNGTLAMNDVVVNAHGLAKEFTGITGLNVYGINSKVTGTGFTANDVKTGIKLGADSLMGNKPGATGSTVDLKQVKINAFRSGVEVNGVGMFGNVAGLDPDEQPTMKIDGFEINVNGTWSRLDNVMGGATATQGGKMYLSNGTLNVTGNGYELGCSSLGINCTTAAVRAEGGSIIGSNSYISLENVDITTKGAEIGGIYSVGTLSGGNPLIDAKNVSVSTDGYRSYGLYANGNNINTPIIKNQKATINGENVDVYTKGERGYGAFAFDSGVININGGSIYTEGKRGYGAYASGEQSEVNLTGVTITTAGDEAHGLVAKGRDVLDFASDWPIVGKWIGQGGAEINLTNSTVATNGVNANGIYFAPREFDDDVALVGDLDVDLASGGKVNLTGSKVTSDKGYGIYVDDSTFGTKGVVTAKDSEIGGRNGLFYVHTTSFGIPVVLERKSELDLTVDNTKLYGRAVTEKGIFNGGILDSSAGVSNVKMSNGSSWTIDGNSNVTNLTLDNSTIQFARNNFGENRGNGFVTLTVDGNYVGNNGTILFNTKLGDSNSPTDFLHIAGNASGDTNVRVANRDGLGALTTGDGIKLIQIDGRRNTANFNFIGDATYQGRQVTYGGAYAYSLYQNGVTNPKDGDWYLRSVYDGTTVDPTDPTDPTNPQKPKPRPVYQAGAPLYEVYGEVLRELNSVSTLRQRVGNRVWVGTMDPQPFKKGALETQEPSDIVDGRGFWMRVQGGTSHFNPDRSTTNADYDLDIFKAQFGLDFTVAENEQGSFIGGVFVQYGHGKADVNSRYGDGNIKTDAYGFGGNLTWYGANDVYVDAQALVNWFDSDLHSDTANQDLVSGNDGLGYALSLEAGRKLALNHEWTMTPQAQLSWNSIDFDDFTDAFAARVSKDDGDSLLGRVGLSFDRETQWQDEKGQTSRLKAFAIGNLYYEFLDDATNVNLAGVRLSHRNDQFQGGIGGGASYNWANDAYSLYSEVDARSSFNDFGDSYAISGTVGFKAKF